MKRLILSLLSLPMIAAVATAQPGVAAPGPRALESHYFSFAAGVPINSYPDDTKATIEHLQSYDGVTRVPIDGEIGVLWPVVDNHTVLGPSFRATSDIFNRGDEAISFMTMNFGASARRYFTGVVGDGLYGRLDAGVAYASLTHRIGDQTFTGSGNVGFAGTAGAGWSFAVSPGTSIELGAAASYRRLPGHETGVDSDQAFEAGSYVSGIFSVGVLW